MKNARQIQKNSEIQLTHSYKKYTKDYKENLHVQSDCIAPAQHTFTLQFFSLVSNRELFSKRRRRKRLVRVVSWCGHKPPIYERVFEW